MPAFDYESSFEVEFEVFCAKCGAGLCGQSTTGTTNRRGMPYVQVEPCERCMKEEYERGIEDATEV